MREGYRPERRFGVVEPARALEPYRTHQSVRAVAEALGCHPSTVHDALVVMGEPLRRQGRPAKGDRMQSRDVVRKENPVQREVQELDAARATIARHAAALQGVLGEGESSMFAINETSKALRLLAQKRSGA